MKKIKAANILSVILTLVFMLSCMMVSVSADSTKAPYTYEWVHPVDKYNVIDYYEYVNSEGGYLKTSTINYAGSSAYYKTKNIKLTDAMAEDEIGFDADGNVIFITNDNKIYGVVKNSTNIQLIASDATSLEISNGFVTGYYQNGKLITLSTSNIAGSGTTSTSTSTNTTSNTSNNTTWNSNTTSTSTSTNSNTSNTTTWNSNTTSTSTSSNSNTASNSKYPYLTAEEGELVYVESSDQHHMLYVKDNHLIINNIILYKHGVKEYAFAKDGVVYITSDGYVSKWTFGAKIQKKLNRRKVSKLIYDNQGFCIGYSLASGKDISF